MPRPEQSAQTPCRREPCLIPTLAADMNTRLQTLQTYFLSLLWTWRGRKIAEVNVNGDGMRAAPLSLQRQIHGCYLRSQLASTVNSNPPRLIQPCNDDTQKILSDCLFIITLISPIQTSIINFFFLFPSVFLVCNNCITPTTKRKMIKRN